MTNRDLKKLVQNHLDILEYKRPFVNSEKFVENSHEKWACKELLRFIEESERLPFSLTPIEILDQFTEKMKTYAFMNSKNSLIFSVAQETGEYFIEESWRLIQKGETS